MKFNRAVLILLLLCSLPLVSQAQLYNGIIAPSRAIDWSSTSPGVVGGIPSASWAQCQTIAPYGSSSAPGSPAAINNALASCPRNSYVQLGSGTFYLSGGIVMQPGVVLRGGGANSTQLVFHGGNACGGEGGQICFMDSTAYFYGSTSVQPGGSNSATFCGTGTGSSCSNSYTQGSKNLQFSNVGSAGITNGQYLILDQVNDNPSSASSMSSGILICDNSKANDGCSLQGFQSPSPGRCGSGTWGVPCPSGAGTERNQIQVVKVVSGCSSACSGKGPFNVAVDNGLYAANWNSSKSPGVWWTASNMQFAGLEDLTVNSSAVGTGTESAIYFHGAYNCWVSGVTSIDPNRNHVWLQIAAHVTVQNSYFFGTQNTTSQSYGLEPYYTDANLLVNNIFQQVTQPIVFGSAVGTVFAHNFSIDNVYTTPSAWMEQMSAGGHDAGTMYNLIEGNIGQGYWNDVFHGTGALSTNFRNYWVGWQPGKTESTTAIQLESYQRMMNVVGNVLGCNNGSSSYPGNCGTPYQTAYTTHNGVGNAGSIFDLNAGNSQSGCGISPGCTVLDDPYIQTSLLRWGNYDVVNAAPRWVSTEVPSGLSDGYANPVPSGQSLPASFWSTGKPAWWTFPGGNAAPWPGIGPDVSGGNIPGLAGHAYFNPAANCYFNVMSGSQDGSGSMLSFNADNCYAGGGTVVVNPPTGLTAVVH